MKQRGTEDLPFRWKIPFSVRKKNMLDDLKKALPPIAIARIVIIYTIIFFIIRELVLRRLPDIEADWLVMYFASFSYFLVAPIAASAHILGGDIEINRKGVLAQMRQTVVLHRFEDIAALNIDTHAQPLPLLRITFLDQRRDDKTYPIAPDVPLDRLAALLAKARSENR